MSASVVSSLHSADLAALDLATTARTPCRNLDQILAVADNTPITHIFGNQIWGEMLSTAQVLVGGAKYGCMFAHMRIYNKYVENVR